MRSVRCREPSIGAVQLGRPATRLSSRSVTVQHGAPRLRHLPGDRRCRGGGDPSVPAGALASGDVQIGFKHTDFSFLQSAPFLLGMVVGAIVVAVIERRGSATVLERGPVGLAVAGAAVALGALLFAGSLCRGHYAVWP